MIRLNEIEQVMKSQFVWDREGLKPMQVDEEYEGNKELARTVFVGLADMYGFEATEVMQYIDCGYDSYRHKISQFRESYKIGRERDDAGQLKSFDDSINKLYIKTCLCLNSIKHKTQRNPYLKLEELL
jgi:hypothetical protein